MTLQAHIDVDEAQRTSERLTEAAEQLRQRRAELFSRLANGDGIAPAVKVNRNVKVTIGTSAYEHSGSRAGEIVAAKLHHCGEAYRAVEDGLRAMGTIMARMSSTIGETDDVTAESLQSVLAGLHSRVPVAENTTAQQPDWFGLEGR